MNFLLLASLSIVSHLAGHITLSFHSYSCPSSPCRSELLKNFIFLTSWTSTYWLYVFSIPLDNFIGLPVVCET